MQTSPLRHARLWHGLTFAVAAGSVLLQLVLVLQGNQHLGDTLPGVETAGDPDLSTRLVRFWSFLTIWFNVIVAGTCALLAMDPVRDGRVWRALRADGLVLAVGGGLVHWFVLRPILNLHGADYLADKLLHIVVPVMTLAGWIRFGPRARLDRTDLAGSAVQYRGRMGSSIRAWPDRQSLQTETPRADRSLVRREGEKGSAERSFQ